MVGGWKSRNSNGSQGVCWEREAPPVRLSGCSEKRFTGNILSLVGQAGRQTASLAGIRLRVRGRRTETKKPQELRGGRNARCVMHLGPWWCVRWQAGQADTLHAMLVRHQAESFRSRSQESGQQHIDASSHAGVDGPRCGVPWRESSLRSFSLVSQTSSDCH